jgi:adenosylcobinamide kinase / adenosylcobinamide-phosphate guanylyltransferase
MKLLVLGGARSGKSAYAEMVAEESHGQLIYIATAEPRDEEMDDRVRLHRERRGPRWTTHEEPIELLKLLQEVAHHESFILVDCLTLWLSNLMFAERDIERESQLLALHLPSLAGQICFVSNEVGQGIVPDNKLARDFRDHAGRLNQAIAAACERVVFITAGLPLQLKG